MRLWEAVAGASDAALCLDLLHSFIAHAIRHCYQPVGGGGSPSDFYLCSLLASGTAALACVFLGVTVDRFGRRGILLLSMTLTGIASLVLLGLWDCEYLLLLHLVGIPQPGNPNRGVSGRLWPLHLTWTQTFPRPLSSCANVSIPPFRN